MMLYHAGMLRRWLPLFVQDRRQVIQVSRLKSGRKTIRHYVREMLAPAADGEPNSSTPATGSPDAAEIQIPLPRPPAISAEISPSVAPKLARSACEPHREWIEAQVRLGRNAVAIYQGARR
jgi:hypothetical protein